MNLPAKLRLAALLPAPLSLSDYEPFTMVGSGPFGTTTVEDVSERAYKEALAAFRKAFGAGATCGISPIERAKAVFFDMDATVIAEESLVELAVHAGHGAAVERITERAMAGELDFKAALIERVAVLKGLSADVLPEVAERLTLNRGIQQFVAFCREIGVPTFLVSGGFTVLASVIQRKVGFDGIHANVLGIENGRLTGTVEGEIVDALGKRRYMLDTCTRLKIDPKAVAAVGDGANDLPMLEAAGVAVGFKPKPVLLPSLHAQNAVGNHAFLAPLLFGRDLGIRRER